MPVVHLGSLEDPRLAWYRGVADPAMLRAGGRFVAEGRTVVARLLEQPRWPVESILVSPAAFAALEPVLSPRLDCLTVFVLPLAQLVSVAGYNVHRGCLAIGHRASVPSRDTLVGERDEPVLLLGLEGLADPDNVGAAFRNAAAFGVNAVLLDDATTDPLYRKAIRTSAAATLQVPFARVGEWAEAVPTLRQKGVAVVGLTPQGGATDLGHLDRSLLAAPRLMLLAGSEGHGLHPATLETCDVRVRIAMAQGVDSLNVATAAAIVLHACAGARRIG